MASGRQATKIKTAGDITADYTVPANSIATAQVTIQAAKAGESGRGVVAITGADIDSALVYDADRVGRVSDDSVPFPGPGVRTGNTIILRDKVSFDNGNSWVRPSTAGGAFLPVGRLYSSSGFRLGLAEWLKGEDTIRILNYSSGSKKYDLYLGGLDSVINNIGLKKIFISSFGTTEDAYGNGVSIFIRGYGHYYSNSGLTGDINLTDNGDSYIDSYTNCEPAFLFGNADGNTTTGYRQLLCTNSSTGVVIKFYAGNPGADFSAGGNVTFSGEPFASCDTMLLMEGYSYEYMLFFSKANQKMGYFRAYSLYSLGASDGFDGTLSSHFHPDWLNEDLRFARYVNNDGEGPFHIYTDKGIYKATTIDGEWTKYPYAIKSNQEFLSNALSIRKERYIETFTMTGTDWRGNDISGDVVKGEDGMAYELSSVSFKQNTQALYYIDIPDTAEKGRIPAEATGILLSGEDSLSAIGDVDINLSISAAEQ